MAIDYSVQVILTTQIILSHDDNQTKIVTTANTINTLLTSAGSSRIRLQYGVTRITEIPEYYRNTGIPVKNIGIPVKDIY